jgi:hypothetical protein
MANISFDLLGFFMAPKSLIEEHNNRLVVVLWDDISLVVEMLDELTEGLTHLLDDAG